MLVPSKKEDKDPNSDVSKDAKEFKKEIKKRHFQDLRQFYIGTFDIRLDGIDLEWLQEVHETLLRKDDVLRVTKTGKEVQRCRSNDRKA